MKEVQIRMFKEVELDYGVDIIRSPKDAVTVLRAYIGFSDRERLVVICLDTKNQLTAINTVSIGSLNASLGHPREIFKPAILANSAAIILGHNHPSGITKPSQDDIELTKRIAEGGKILGIDLLDHVVIGDDEYCSMKEESLF